MQTTLFNPLNPFTIIHLILGKRLLVLVILCSHFSCKGQPENKSYKYLKHYYTKRATKYLIKDKQVKQAFSISDSGIVLYTTPEKGHTKEVEYYLPWQHLRAFQERAAARPSEAFKYYKQRRLPQLTASLMRPAKFIINGNPAHPLKGLRVALDPGHIAGNLSMAKKERKFIDMTLASGKRISFFESELAWYTCRVLADMLEQKGAQVMLTRKRFDLMALDSTYQQVFENYRQQQAKKGIKVKRSQKWLMFFKKFRKADFNARIEKINNFKPHLTMIVHYNVDGANAPWNKPTAHNNCMAFVAGSFMKNELSATEHRFNFLRLLLTKDIESSIGFSKAILQQVVTQLNVPILPKQNNQPFINRACIATKATGVYARNLSMARKTYGTLCFIEPLYQDNKQEVRALGNNDYELKGKKIPTRVVEVAKAYYKGIVAYLKK
ncbi:N-acetylmuramoyl-L-alanine amidase [uncultured Microscilla sp.]|uniref:N-acetylmuramoyl-L-alanine amidase n=1 Tax=uncultured Microscilla sp. TaxID=432653 RepID=UPI00260F7472|nr:N-acetylmuramoyl-L-alanine amidase [uncultured Microscilla sp.]